jgi:hypothetical protein
MHWILVARGAPASGRRMQECRSPHAAMWAFLKSGVRFRVIVNEDGTTERWRLPGGWRARETARIWSEPCMSCLGVHFALLPEEAAALEAIDDEGGRLEHLQNEIEVRYFESARDYLAQSDKSWDAMHRTLADAELTWEGGDYPLNHTVLAGRLLYSGDD